jgi:Leucine-rich repeat (LRR) protein
LYRLTELEDVRLSRNCIKSLDDEIVNWKSLRRLALDHNQIEFIPENISELACA